jgi:catechol 2,3-dioxygenase-like lactoylglutathione lyase family enzyme
MSIPGIRNMDHLGITVPNVKEACDFFENILGSKVLYTAAQNIFDPNGNWMEEQFNVHPRAEIKELVFVKMPGGTILELFEYYSPDQSFVAPKNSDVGGHHIAIYVEDIYEAIGFLKENNISVLGDPISYSDGPDAGLTCCYFLSPWGLQLELVSISSGTTYYSTL